MRLDPGGAFAFLTLAKVIKGGTKVIDLDPKIARILVTVDLNLEIEDYAQPFEAVGVVIPATALGRRSDLIANCYWTPEMGLVVDVFLGGGTSNYFNITPGMGRTIEEILSDPEFGVGMSPAERIENRNLIRIAMNACLFATERGVRPRRPDRKTHKKRRPRRARPIHEATILEIQNLDLFLRASHSQEGGGGSEGIRQPMHRRRGHWKMQPYGPGRSQRKRIFVHSYMVHPDPDRDLPSVIS